MSEQEKDVERNNSLQFDDITGFFMDVGVKSLCPACGKTKWTIIAKSADSEDARYPTIPVGNKELGISEGFNIPVVICVCKNCFYMRMHSRARLEEWVARKKGGIGDGD